MLLEGRKKRLKERQRFRDRRAASKNCEQPQSLVKRKKRPPPKQPPPLCHRKNTRGCPDKPKDTENQQLVAQRSQDYSISGNAYDQDFDNGATVSPSYLQQNIYLPSNKDHEDKEAEDMDTSKPPPNERQPNEDSSSNKNAGKKFITFADTLKPRPIQRKQQDLSYEGSDYYNGHIHRDDYTDNESELSDFVDEDPDSFPNTSEDDDYEYEDVKEYLKTSEPVYDNFATAFDIMAEHLEAYWKHVKLVNESRKKIIKELNGHLSKSRNFSVPDVLYMNAKIRSIEYNLNVGIPVISKMKASFIRDSQKQQVLYQGFKFSRHYNKPTIYACTYDEDPNLETFGWLNCCKGYLIIDGKGFLQPGSIVTHYHGNVKDGYKVQDLASPKIDHVALPRLTPEGDIAGKRFTLNQFLSTKRQESFEYSKEVSQILPKKYFIDEQMKKLRSFLNNNELEETDKNYLSSFIQWIEYILQHVRINNIH